MRQFSAFFVFFLSALTVQAQFNNGQAARAVLGQQNFTAGNSLSSQSILGGVSGLAYYNGVLYVADSNRVAALPENSRIMAFPTGQIPSLRANVATAGLTNTDCYLCGFPASFSLGQSTFVPADVTNGFGPSRSQSGLNDATGVATDGHHFAVADTDNNRILIWNEVPTTMDQNADLVLGQPDFTTLQTPAVSYTDNKSFRGPQGVWIQNNKLFVADTQNNRVLIWNSIPTQNNQPADVVLGQVDFNHNTQPAPSSSDPVAAANQLLNPTSVTSDGTHLFVSDLGFNRVLIWNSIPTTIDQNADVAVGQTDMTSTTANDSNVCVNLPTGLTGQCQTSLNYPRYALSDGTRLFIADSGNDRVVIFDHIPVANGAAFNAVLGQPDFVQDVVSSASISIASTAIDNTGGVDLLPTPQALAYDGANLYVSDPYNRRVLVFTAGDTPLPPNSIVNWASEIVRQEGLVAFTGTTVAGDIMTVTINGTAYTYTVVAGNNLDAVANGVVAAVNSGSGDPNVTALFAGTGTGSVYFSSKGTDLGYDTITLAATSSNTANETATASGAYLSAGTAATAAIGMLVEINGTNLSDNTASATLNGTSTLPTTLGGAQVFMDGYACPILKASPTQIITQVPYSYGDRNSTSVYVRTTHSNGSVTVTSAVPVYIAPANPGIFNAPATAGQSRPWPIAMAFHQPGNATAVVSIDGSVTAANIATITIQGTAYNYTVVAADTLTTITQNLINQINASDPYVTASLGGAFTRVVLTAKQPGSAGYGITVAGSTSTSATVTVTAYSTFTCCVVTPGSLITPANPAGPGEMITVTGVGLGIIVDPTNTAQSSLGTGVPYAGPVPNTAQSFVSATMGGTTAQVIFAELPTRSYGIYNMQVIVPQAAATSSATPFYVAQNAFISNTVTVPVGPTVISTATGTATVTAPATNFRQSIGVPAAGATISGTIAVSGWALSTATNLLGVNVSVDGVVYGPAIRTFVRQDVCGIYTSPDCPTVGWYIMLDSTQFADGTHSLSITSNGADGSQYTTAQSFIISNHTVTSPQRGSIDSPSANLTYRGVNLFSGWAINSNSAVAGVSIYIDGAPQGAAAYGTARPDVCTLYPGRPGCPNVGWSFEFDTTKIANGTHSFAAKAVSANGQTYTFSKTFVVSNFTTVSSTHVSIDTPSATAGVFSGAITVGGWALDDHSAIASVYIGVDGVNYGAAAYGAARPDACAALGSDPGCPNVGFDALLDTTLLTDGAHTLTVTVNPVAGQSSTYKRPFSVANEGTAANPVRASVDAPTVASAVSGVFSASGWAVSSADAVTSIEVSIDGRVFGNATYGTSRPDVCTIHSGPSCPNVGWSFPVESSQLSNGNHQLEITVATASGHRASAGKTFAVSNPVTGPGHTGFDVPGSNSNPYLGQVLFSGWAVNDNTSVSSLTVTIDGVPYGLATYGLARTDICLTYPASANCPNVGWSFGLDTTRLADGSHTLGLTANNADGSFFTASSTFVLANYSGVNPMRISIGSPVNSTNSPVFGLINVAGWALDDASAISAVTIAIDGVPAGTAAYGGARPDVCSVFSGRLGCPNVGFNFQYDTTMLPNGLHTVAVTGVTSNGQTSTASEQISVAN